jgi:hypothetical protein
MGVLNAIFAPFIVIYLLIYSFFRYFEVGVHLDCRLVEEAADPS